MTSAAVNTGRRGAALYYWSRARGLHNAGAAHRATSTADRGRQRLEADWPSKDVSARPSAAAAMLRVSCIRCCQELLRMPQELAS